MKAILKNCVPQHPETNASNRKTSKRAGQLTQTSADTEQNRVHENSSRSHSTAQHSSKLTHSSVGTSSHFFTEAHKPVPAQPGMQNIWFGIYVFYSDVYSGCGWQWGIWWLVYPQWLRSKPGFRYVYFKKLKSIFFLIQINFRKSRQQQTTLDPILQIRCAPHLEVVLTEIQIGFAQMLQFGHSGCPNQISLHHSQHWQRITQQDVTCGATEVLSLQCKSWENKMEDSQWSGAEITCLHAVLGELSVLKARGNLLKCQFQKSESLFCHCMGIQWNWKWHLCDAFPT